MRSSISACFFVLVERYEPQAAEKFFGAAVLQKCWIKKLFVSPVACMEEPPCKIVENMLQ